MPTTEIVISVNTERLVETLKVLRTLASQIGFVLDTAILSLTSKDDATTATTGCPVCGADELASRQVENGPHLTSCRNCGWEEAG